MRMNGSRDTNVRKKWKEALEVKSTVTEIIKILVLLVPYQRWERFFWAWVYADEIRNFKKLQKL